AEDADRRGPIKLLRERQRIVAVENLKVCVVVIHGHRQRLGRGRIAEVLAAIRFTLPNVLTGVFDQACDSTRGKRGASVCTRVPGLSAPHVPAARSGCACSAPRLEAPSDSQSVAVDCGITGESRTASALSPSAQV